MEDESRIAASRDEGETIPGEAIISEETRVLQRPGDPTLIRRRVTTTQEETVPLVAPPAGGIRVDLAGPYHPKKRSVFRNRIIPSLLFGAFLLLLWYSASAPRTISDLKGEVWTLPDGSKLGSWYIPYVGETIDFVHNPFKFGLDHAKSYGPVSYSNMLWQDTIILSGRALDYFYNTTNIGRRGAYPMHVVDLLGGEVLPMLDEPLHSQRRAWLMKAFEPGLIEDQLYKVEDLVRESVVRWESMKKFHWVSELRRLTSRIAGSLLFADPRGGEFHAKNFENVIEAMTAIPISFPSSKYRAGEASRDELFKWYLAYATEVLHGEKAGLEMGHLLRADERARQLPIDSAVREMHHIALSIYGIHNSLAFLLQAISQHADVWRRAKAEVEAVSPIGQITIEKMQQMPYLSQLIDEVRRYYPIFPGLFGYVRDGFSIDDAYLPKGAIVYASLYASNHDPSIFQNPHVFDPSRFYQGVGRGTLDKPFNYFSHGAGELGNYGRHCPGEDLTSSVMKILLVHVLRGYSWSLPSQNLEPRWDRLLPTPKSGLWVNQFMQSDQSIQGTYLRE